MTVRFTARRLAGIAVAVLASASLSSCSQKVTSVDGDYTTLEGVTSPEARLVVWHDAPSYSYRYEDHNLADPDTLGGDILIETTKYQRYDDHTIHGMIFDQTMANRFEGFRKEDGGGLREFVDFRIESTVKWLETETELFHFVDRTPANFQPPTYICRGAIQGVVNPESPLTNYGSDPLVSLTNMDAVAKWDRPSGMLDLTWSAVPNASRYLIQVYVFRNDLQDLSEKILAGTPAPIYDGSSNDLWVAFAPGTVTRLFVQDPARTDLTVFRSRPLTFGGEYLVRVSAFDAQGRMIGITFGLDDPIKAFLHHQMGIERTLNEYLLYRLSAVLSFLEQRGGGGTPG
jgi:hypothetical protein